MLIIGHPNISFSPLFSVDSKQSIAKTPPNSTLLFDFSRKDLLSYCQDNNLDFALHVKSLSEACLANAMGAIFLLVSWKNATQIQTIANEYLFDAKILVSIKEEAQIEDIAKAGIDGVLFPKGQIKVDNL